MINLCIEANFFLHLTDGTQYTGVGRNKKDAKKHCAMEALKVLYNVQYPGTLTADAEALAAAAANA